MRESAKRRGKAVPTFDQLESLANAIGLTCPVCSRPMNWLRVDGTQAVVTLQHNHDGTMTLLCMSCNCRHETYENDSLYEIGPDQKRCSKCKAVKPLEAFCIDKHNRWADRKTTCRECSKINHDSWITRNRERYNAYMRAYNAKRKQQGK